MKTIIDEDNSKKIVSKEAMKLQISGQHQISSFKFSTTNYKYFIIST
jgi:hypothetical protein